MSALPAFSICIPCLNAGPYLRERFDCLLAQTHRDFEIVVLDSESTDGSWEIILDYAARDPRIRARREPRRGLYEDWNACVALARHDWIYVATADDTLAPDALAVFGAAIRDHPEARLIGSRLWQIDTAGRDHTPATPTHRRPLLGCRHRTEGWCSPWPEFLHAVLVSAPFNSVTQIVFHREAFARAGGFATRYGACGNGALQLRILLAEPAYYLPRRLGSWRRHPAQISVTRPVSEHGNLRATLAHIAKDALAEGLVPSSLPFEMVVGLACGTTQREPPPGLPPRAARLARRFHALGLFHRPRPRLAAFAILGLLARIFPHPRAADKPRSAAA